jgi:hypothetical protein
MEHLSRIRKDGRNPEAIGKLAGHQLVGVTGRDQLAVWQIAQLIRMLVSNHTATDDRHTGFP